MDTKELIRKELLEKRDSIPSKEWDEMSSKIMRKLLKSSVYNDCDGLFIYGDYHNEVGTIMLIEDALLKGKKVYLPKVLEGFNEAKMEFYEITSSFELVEGYKKIREPMGNPERQFVYESRVSDKLLMLVPGVAFDKDGNRIGYGKGYYDNYLRDKDAFIKVGICFSIQILDKIPFHDTDIKLDYVISEITEDSYIKNINFKG